jgi:hypothetical protein
MGVLITLALVVLAYLSQKVSPILSVMFTLIGGSTLFVTIVLRLFPIEEGTQNNADR